MADRGFKRHVWSVRYLNPGERKEVGSIGVSPEDRKELVETIKLIRDMEEQRLAVRSIGDKTKIT